MSSLAKLEDGILEILRGAGLGDGIQIGSLPVGKQSERLFSFRSAAVWVCYAGSSAGPPRNMTRPHVQRRTTRWSVLVLALNYRGSSDAAGDALPLLESVIDNLSGREVEGGLLVLERDGLVDTGKPGVVGYEAVFSADGYLRK